MLLPLVLFFALLLPNPSEAKLFRWGSSSSKACISFLNEATPQTTYKNINYPLLVKNLQKIVKVLRTHEVDISETSWVNLLEDYVVPMMEVSNASNSEEGRKLIISLVGFTNSGKSTLFGSLDNILNGVSNEPPSHYSEVGIDPGLTQRLVFLTSDQTDAIDALSGRFGAMKPAGSLAESSRTGIPLYVNSRSIPSNIVFADTPGIENLLPDHSTASYQTPGLNVLKNSESAIFIFNPRDLGDKVLLNQLKNIVKQWGKRKIILAFNVDPHIRPDDAEIYFTQMARLFDPHFNMNQVGNRDSQIMGTYILPVSTEVFQGHASSDLIPVGKTLPFPELVQYMNENVYDIWQQIFGDVIEKIIVDARRTVSDFIVESLRVKLMQQSVDLMVARAAEQSISPFPYEETKSLMHHYWDIVGSNITSTLRNIARNFARPDRVFLNWWTNRKGDEIKTVSFEKDRLRDFKGAEELRVEKALETIISQLSSRNLIIDESYYDDPRLRTLVMAIHENLDEMRSLMSTNAANALTTSTNFTLRVPLGKFGRADGSLERSINNLTTEGLERHINGVLRVFSDYLPRFPERNRRALLNHLSEFRLKQGLIQNGIENVLVGAYVTLPPTIYSSELWGHMQNGWTLNPLVYAGYAVPAVFAANMLQIVDNKWLDRTLEPVISDWARDNQLREFTNYVDTYMLPEIRIELQRAQERVAIGADEGRRLLDLINTLYEGEE